jgi:hypothetical protein
MLCHSAVDPTLDTLSSPLPQHFFAYSMKYVRLSPWNLLFIFAPSSGIQSVSEYHTVLFIGDCA